MFDGKDRIVFYDADTLLETRQLENSGYRFLYSNHKDNELYSFSLKEGLVHVIDPKTHKTKDNFKRTKGFGKTNCFC